MCANSLTHFSLFTGIGGIDLASEWAGFETIGQVELEEYQYNVLCKHWPDVPKWRDIRHVTKESLQSTAITNCTVLSGGFPCQPFSKAGKRRGTNDDRYLWPEMLRVLKLLNPRWLVAENVAGIITLEQPDCISSVEDTKTIKHYYERVLPAIIKDIEEAGYILPRLTDGTPIVCNIPACGIGAPHRRERIFIIAHREDVADTNCSRLLHGQTKKQPTERRKQTLSEPKSSSEDVPNPSNIDVQREFSSVFDTEKRQEQDNRPPRPHHNGFRQWTTECRLGGTLDGFSKWLDGNGKNIMYISHERVITSVIEHATTEKGRPCQILRTLWNEIRKEILQWKIRGSCELHTQKILFTYLCKLEETSETLDNIPSESTETQKETMRSMWNNNESTSTPYKSKYKEQQKREYTNTLQTLSRFLAHDCKTAWEEYCRKNATALLNPWKMGGGDNVLRVAPRLPTTVDRLKCLGNAVVPQQIYPIFEAIYNIETNS